MRALMLSTVIYALALHNVAAHDPAAEATYLGNEGVMVARGETKILFDAFYAESYDQYALVPDDISDAMMAGAKPYDGIDAVFVSHVHGDHFTAEPAIAYLRAQPHVRLYGSQQIHDAIVEAGVAEDDPLMTRVVALDLAPTDPPETIRFDGLDIDVVAIPHAGDRPDIQNLAWRVALDGATTVMHLGDAGTVVSDFSRHLAHFKARKTHAAFPPYWFFGDQNGDAILNDIIEADQAIGIHVPARAAGNGDEWRTRAGGDLFTDPGETREIGGK